MSTLRWALQTVKKPKGELERAEALSNHNRAQWCVRWARSETADIDETIQQKIDDMIAEKTGSDVALTSFVDARNTDVERVQFVITTPAVHVPDEVAELEAEEEGPGILQKIRNLFK